ncbi:MAG TPA: GNAT family N-acetyltransferase [Cyclobacteriaceae bacterium]|nr:GNAT family N-acetyltransferase [Cyclobacteriaceae bacterium]
MEKIINISEVNNIEIKIVSPSQDSVARLIAKLDRYQIALYGIENCNLEPSDTLMQNKAFMVGAFTSNLLIGIGAVKIVESYAEIKRMFVDPAFRKHGVAIKILKELEEYAIERQLENIYLETGRLQFAAIELYKKMGYVIVDQFGQYRPNSVSIYFQKRLKFKPIL